MPVKSDYPKVCLQCGREFLGRKVQIYCSNECRVVYLRTHTRAQEQQEKKKRVQEAKKNLSINAISWAARRANMTYGTFVQQMTKADEERIAVEFAAYLKEQREKEKEQKLTWI